MRTWAVLSPLSMTVSWLGQLSPRIGTPASSVTSIATSWPERNPDASTGGVMRGASGTVAVGGTAFDAR